MDEDIPPGYERWREQGLRLIDPRACPDGHPWAADGTWTRGYATCAPHHGHPSWRCWCGRQMFLRDDGAIVAELDCVSGR